MNLHAKRWLMTASLVSLSAILAACTSVGPDYRIPDQAVVNNPAATGKLAAASEAAYTSAALPADWWRLYRDPQLDQLITRALEANPDIRAAAAHLRIAREAVAATERERLPQVGFDAAPGYGRPSAVQMGIPFTLPDSGNYDAGISIAYQVDLFGKLTREEQAVVADAGAVQATYEAARMSVVAGTAGAYADICSLTHQQEVLEKQIALQEQYVKLVADRVRLGRGSALDNTRAGAQLLQLKAQRPAWVARQKLARYQLAALLGEVPGHSPLADELSCRQAPQLTSAIPVGDGQALMQRRPDIRQAERKLAGASARIGVATAELYPHIRFGASVGSTGLLPGFGAGDAFRWEIGPLITWSLPATNQARIHIRQAEAGADEALARFDATVLNALRETESALTVYARTLDHHQDLEKITRQDELLLHQTETLYRYGRADFLNVLEGRRTLLNNDAAIAASEAALAADQIHLFLAMGGGWQESTPEKTAQASEQK